MTNKDKALQLLESTFNIKILDKDDFSRYFKHCAFIEPDNECRNGKPNCEKCEYKNFWEQDYKGE